MGLQNYNFTLRYSLVTPPKYLALKTSIFIHEKEVSSFQKVTRRTRFFQTTYFEKGTANINDGSKIALKSFVMVGDFRFSYEHLK